MRPTNRLVAAFVALLLFVPVSAQADPLPSWREGSTKSAIIEFVERVTDSAGTDFVDPADRIAVFDNDGTLWAEKPFYFQIFFAMDRIAALAEADPAFASTPALKAAANGDALGLLAMGKAALLEILRASHTGLTISEFDTAARAWLAESTHLTKGRPFHHMTYQPMLELLAYLRDAGFTTYIVSGGGQHFIRAFAEDAYGIPPNQVIGSQFEASYELRNGEPVIVKLPEIALVDDKAGKPVAIDRHIGKRPIFAAGNSDGDFEMLEWTTSGDGPRFGLIVHHTDGEREWAYDRNGHVGVLKRGLDEAAARDWLLVDMKEDWATIFGDRR